MYYQLIKNRCEEKAIVIGYTAALVLVLEHLTNNQFKILSYAYLQYAWKQISVFEHLSYLSELACDIFMLSKLKNLFQKLSFWITWKLSKKYNKSTEKIIRNWLKAMSLGMEMFDCVYVRKWVHWKQSHWSEVCNSTYY